MAMGIHSDMELPAYHKGMLIFKMRQERIRQDSSFLAALPANPNVSEVIESFEPQGIRAIERLDLDGKIKRLASLGPSIRQHAVYQGVTKVAATFADVVENVSAPDKHAESDPSAGSLIVELNEDDVQELRSELEKDPSIESVSKVPARYLTLPASDSQSGPSPLWNLTKIRWPELRSLSGFTTAGSIKVAVLDTGIDVQHPDLQGRIRDYVFTYPNIAASSERDIIGHGTHVAGTIGALNNRELNICGLCECPLFVWKIFSDTPMVDDTQHSYYVVEPVMYLQALVQCLNRNMDVINLSIQGIGEPDDLERRVFERLLNKGTTIVAAMGNLREVGSPTVYPAAFPGVIAVGATAVDDTVANFSSSGDHIALSAPGVAIKSTLPTYPGQSRRVICDTWEGTSMATPHVTAAAALLLSNRSDILPHSAWVRVQLQRTADRVAAMGNEKFHPDYGTGRLNLFRLLTE